MGKLMNSLFGLAASFTMTEKQTFVETANRAMPNWKVIKACPSTQMGQYVFCFDSEPIFYDTETDTQVVGWDNYETSRSENRSALVGMTRGVNPRTWEIRR